MTTLAILKARIADELLRTDLTSQIGYAIADAVALYQKRRFRFTQHRSTFATVAGTEFYAAPTIPSDIVQIDSLRLTVNGRQVVMTEWGYGELEAIATTTNTQAQPVAWAWYADQIRLYPVPDAAYTVTLSYQRAIAAPTLDTDSNVWTTDAANLIRHAAKRIIATDVLMSTNDAAMYAQSEGLEYRRLVKEANDLVTGGLRGCM